MKVVAAAALLLFASLQAVEAEDGDVRARDNRDGSKQGHQGPSPNVNEKSMKKFKAKCQLKSQANPSLQEIRPDSSSFTMGDKEMSLADGDLEPIEVFVSGAKVVVDGVEQEARSCVFKEKGDDGSLIARDRTGKLVLASSIDRVTGKTMNVIPVEDGSNVYATASSDDVDNDMLNEFTLEDAVAPFGRSLHVQSEDMDARFLEDKDCNYYGYDIIEMAVVVDSYLCIDKGGSDAVEALAHSIVAGASQFYEVAGLCVKLRISYLEIHCDPNTDPIRPLLDAAGTSEVCSSGLLGYFADYVRTNGINADVNHLFHGKDFTGVSTIGCAYVGTLCNTGGYNTGVNEINYTSFPSSMYKLVAHENGHICSARHVTNDTNDVMYPSICGYCNSFGSTSKGSINQKIASTSCTAIEDRAPDFTYSPTPAPTGTPTAAPTPCDNASFVLDLTTDKYAYETSWELMTSDGTIVETSPNYEQYSNYTREYCVPDEELTFTIYDSFGDGICCRYGNGSYQIFFKGNLVASGGEFGSSESVMFGGPSPATADPTEQPTQAPLEPTVAPTLTPTESPVEASTTTPTKSPVAASTTTPTKSPVATSTTTPTKSPTAVPSLTPTKHPTEAPSLTPTKSPTVAPTLAPTKPPTAPTSSPIEAPSSTPTKSPVVAATSAPTNSPSCAQEFVLDLQTDNYPAETSWELKKASDGTILASREQGFYSSKGTSHNEEYCVPDEEMIFIIYDSYGDGICCGYGSGSYQITFKGDLAASGGEFGSQDSVMFGGGPATASPTKQPSKPPTQRPTELPTELPTKSPTDTAAPTKSPTEAPTKSPTSPPTKSPTFSPTKSPTTRPTESPTEQETCTKKPQGDKCKNNDDCCSNLCERAGKKKRCVSNRRRNLKGAKLEPSKHKVRRRSGF